MNTTDLYDLLTERAETAAPAAPTTDARLDGALSKARTIRRRRRTAFGVAAAAAVGVLGGVAIPSVLTADSPTLATPTEIVLPEYELGGALLGSATVELPQQSASVTVTPNDFPLSLIEKCDEEPFRLSLETEITVNGEHVIKSGGCGRGFFTLEDDSFGEWEAVDTWREAWERLGVRPGEPATFTVTVTSAQKWGSDTPINLEALDVGSLSVGIYQRVPWDEYEFPPRPDNLHDTAEWRPDPGASTTSDPDEPNIAREFTVAHVDATGLVFEAQTPGIIRIFVNDVEIDRAEFWDYGTYGYGTGIARRYRQVTGNALPEGEPVRIKLIPEHFTGAWQTYLNECPVNGDGTIDCVE